MLECEVVSMVMMMWVAKGAPSSVPSLFLSFACMRRKLRLRPHYGSRGSPLDVVGRQRFVDDDMRQPGLLAGRGNWSFNEAEYALFFEVIEHAVRFDELPSCKLASLIDVMQNCLTDGERGGHQTYSSSSSIFGRRSGQSSLTHKCAPSPATEQTQRVLLQSRLSTDSHDFGNEACYRTTIAMHTDAHRPCLCSMRHLLTILEQPCFRSGTGFAW